MNYRECFEEGRRILTDAKIEEAELDARLLLEYVCGTRRHDLLVHGDKEVIKVQLDKYFLLLGQRAKHIPLQHLTGIQEFMGLTFQVNEHVLIPRQDTEILVEEVLKELHDGMRILDMCTGSGCILISLLRYSNDCVGVGADISEKALLVANENGKRILGDHDVKWIHTDLFEKVEGKFDRIVSNPPYIRSKVIDTLMPEVRDYEPLSALDGSEDGLVFYRRIVQEAPKYLECGGSLYFEIGYDQGSDVRCLMEQAGFVDVEVVQDYAGLDRVVYGTYVK
ncbi:MAG: peptide chain release factor N(5)-glutamine methyltransferase [Lachnospiraceae bacterium]|nr:peptide chain release factor N(5)-glutamine methyltransferase [Lachnospiraceae bacterium]